MDVKQTLLVSAFTALVGVVERLVTENVNEPFIDEIFHLTQCNTYCHYRFDIWDNKITTPPGLYWLGFVYAKIIETISSTSIGTLCSNYEFLRSLNLIGGVVVLPLILSRFPKSDTQFSIVNIISLPLLFTYYFLFYTDIWSLVLIVLSLCFAIKSKSTTATLFSGLAGFASLWFRQTNIIWIAFIASVYIQEHTTATNDSITYVKRYISAAISKWLYLVPYIINFILFAVFLKVNGGITFGDKENHQVQLHIVQVFYCFMFINFFTFPVWISKKRIINYLKFTTGIGSKYFALNLIITVTSCAAINLIIRKFTIVHPFLLADNRHYTFYIWRKILSKKYSDIFMIPVYHFSVWNIVKSFNSNKSRLSLNFMTIVTFFIAVVLTIVPSPLFEPRYYIIPLVLFRLFVKSSNDRTIAEFIWLNGINVFTLVIFLNYEFTWASEPGQIQRIIW